MTIVTTEFGLDEDRAVKMVKDAQKAFDRAVRILEQSCDNLEALGDTGEGEVLKDLRSMNGALNHTLDMREKARDAGVKRFGTEGAGTLDLDAARAEIGLRLACLRDTGEGTGVSGQSE